jgi:hypothetical protein
MSKVYGTDKIRRRTCLIKGREGEGRFVLLRKQVNVSKIRAAGQDTEDEDVETSLVYDERIFPRPVRMPNKAATELKIYPADKPLRRVCFVTGRPDDQKYHLLRKGVELSKVLAVGTEGPGEWINTSQIHDEHLVPIPIKARVIERKPVRLCKLATTGDQEYLVLRKTDKGAKLLPVYEGNYGIMVTDLSQIVDEITINQAKKGHRKGDAAEGQTDNGKSILDGLDGSQATAAVVQPASTAPPVQPAPPAQNAPVAAQPPRPTVAQPPRPVPMQGAPRPAPVGAGVAPRAPQGRPSGR